MLITRLYVLGLVLVLAAAPLFAQTGSATVQGAVTDTTGAVLAGADVTLTHTQTAVVQKTKTNGAGLYVFPASPIGPYKVTVGAPGMETWEGQIVLQAGLAASVNVILKVGATSTQVTVGDVTPMIDTSTPTISERIDRARIDQLPINDAMGLVALTTPGFEGGSLPRVFGLRDDSAELTVDGGPQSNRSEGGPQGAAPEATYVQEVQVNTLDSSAKFNRPGTVVVVTKSGTNAFHGQLYEANEDNSVAGVARRRENNSNTPPFLILNQFGGSVGGPVYIPKVFNGKNRTFFFFDAYRYYMRQTTSVTTSVPTAAHRSGNFSGLTNASSQPITLYNPYTTGSAATNYSRQPFPGNQIPASMESPLAQYLYSITPLPTVPGVNPQVGNNWISGFPTYQNRDGEILRFDHNISDNDRLFVRLQRGSRLIASPSTTTSAPLLNNVTNLTYNIYPDRNAVLSWTHTLSPTFFSEFLFSNSWENYSFHTGTAANDDVDSILGLPNPFNGKGWPAISNTGYGTTYSASTPRGSVTNIYNGQENLTKTYGKHKIQFGGGIRFEHDNVLPQQQQVPGSDSFGTNYTALYNLASGSAYQATNLTGSPAAEMYMGLLETYNNTFARSYYLWRYQEYALYVQDEFKVAPRLTLSYGLRWEYRPPVSEARNNLISFDKARDAIVLPLTRDQMIQRGYTAPAVYDQFLAIGMKVETPQQAGLPHDMVYPNKFDFGPRAGVAYRLGASARAPVLRGGYGMYFFPIHSFGYEAGMRSNPPESDLYTYNFNSTNYQPLQNWALLSAPTVIAGKNSTNVVNVTGANAIAPGSMNPIVYFNSHLPTTRAHQWNVTLEKEIMENTVVGLSYVGTAGRDLDQSYQYNAAPNAYVWYASTGVAVPTGLFAGTGTRQYDKTTWNNITEYSHIGYSNFEGIRLEVLRRFTKGYAFQWFYVMANALTSVTPNSNTSTTASLVPLDTNLYLPGAVPADLKKLNRFLNYQRDAGNTAPKHHMQWNFIVDLPFGKGKAIGRNAGRALNAAIGGWQLSGTGSMVSAYNALPVNNWANFGKLQMFGKNTKVQDCRSGTCVAGYLWYNAYIPANQVNATNAAGKCTGVCGVPSTYKPIETPLYPTPATGGTIPNAETNNIFITLQNGSVVQTPFNTNLHPFRNQYFLGPFAYGQNATMFKSINVTERIRLRFEANFFNVFNAQGLNQPTASGISSLQTSARSPRQIQLTLRLYY
jgi:hypothetical protein